MSDFDIAAFLKQLPQLPGIYQMQNSEGEILYVGKAHDLKKRVSSYFHNKSQGAKTQSLVSQIASIDVTVTDSETEALLLESNLIKTLRPKYNVLLRDDKSYPYAYVSSRDKFPRIDVVRGQRNALKGDYFGPFPSVSALKETVSLLQKIFKLRTCRDAFFRNRSRPCLQYQIKRCSGPCVGLITDSEYRQQVDNAMAILQGKNSEVLEHLDQLMDEASRELAFEQAAEYRDQIASLRKVQEQQNISQDSGNADVLAIYREQGSACIHWLTVRSGSVVGSRSYFPDINHKVFQSESVDEEILRSFISQFYLSGEQSSRIPESIILSSQVTDADELAKALSRVRGSRCSLHHSVRAIRAKWLALTKRNAVIALHAKLSNQLSMDERLEALRQALGLDQCPKRLECFDISHTGGEETVASCVVFDSQGPLKRDYRRFNIHGITPGDDYAAMKQALMRRYQRLSNESLAMPDILFIDGGKGQVRQALEVFETLGIEDVMLVGIAKGPDRKAGWETLILSDGKQEHHLPADSKALHLIQHIRDESHRFAITGHRHKRDKKRLTSTLEDIDGIGAKRRQALLKHFGGTQGLSRASIDDLAKVRGVSQHLAEKIYRFFHPE